MCEPSEEGVGSVRAGITLCRKSMYFLPGLYTLIIKLTHTHCDTHTHSTLSAGTQSCDTPTHPLPVYTVHTTQARSACSHWSEVVSPWFRGRDYSTVSVVCVSRVACRQCVSACGAFSPWKLQSLKYYSSNSIQHLVDCDMRQKTPCLLRVLLSYT